MENKVKQSETKILMRSEIKPADYNPRVLTDEARKKLKANIKANGLIGGLVYNEQTKNLVSGHQRLSIADEINKYNPETKENDYEIKLEQISVDLKKEKELNIWFNSASVQGTYDYKKLAQIFPDIDASLAGLDDVDISMIEIELPTDIEIEIPSFNPQSEKEEKAMLEKSITQELDNSKPAPATSVHKMEQEMSEEEKIAHVKAIKEKVKEGAVYEGDPYFTISFDTYDNKVQFLEGLGFNPDDKFIKGEEFADKIMQ